MKARSRTPWWNRPEPWGLLLRLLLLPLGACWDLFGNYWVSHQWVYHGTVPAGQYGGLVWVWLPFWLHTGWLWLVRPLLGPGDPWGEGLAPSVSLTEFWITPQALEAFYRQPSIQWMLVLLKIPYVVAEVGLIAFMLRAVGRSEPIQRRLAWFLWLNPFSLYVISLYGAWDIWPVALLIVGVFLLPDRPGWAGVCCGVAIVMKLFPLLLLPFWIVVGARTTRQRLRLTAGALTPLLLGLSLGHWVDHAVVPTVLGLPHYDLLVSGAIKLWWHDAIYVFVVGYGLLLCHAVRFGAVSRVHLVRYSTGVFLLIYSLAFFHVQYVLWVVPLLALVVAEQVNLLWLIGVQVVSYAVYSLQWERALTTYLVAPLHPDVFFRLRSPYEWLAQHMHVDLLIGVAHSLFAAASLWMIYELLRRQPLKRA